MKPTTIGYNFIGTHVNNFIIIAKDSVECIKEFSKIFSLTRKGSPNYFLDNIYWKKENSL